MQIKSRTETKWGNLRAEHEIMFYSSHPGTKTAWQPRDRFEEAHGSQSKVYAHLRPSVQDVRVRRGKQN